MKLVSDFDGVWTMPDDEAAAQQAWMDRTLVAWSGERGRAGVSDWLRDARARVATEPTRYGWVSYGRISAFGDEDPFTRHSGLLHYIQVNAAHDPLAADLRDAVAAHGLTLDAFGGQAHAEGVAEVARTRGPGILPAAAVAGRALLAAGIEVVVVSNSGTDKLASWFTHAGVPNVVHPARTPGALCLRGSARKFVLGEQPSPLRIAAVTIDAARPSYEAALRDERPDAVVGDVFSLDLALPLALRRSDAAFARLRLFWLLRSYTPEWLRGAIESETRGEVEAVDGGLPAVAERLLAAAR